MEDEETRRARAVTGRYSKFAPDANVGDEADFRAGIKANWIKRAEEKRADRIKGSQLTDDYFANLGKQKPPEDKK